MFLISQAMVDKLRTGDMSISDVRRVMVASDPRSNSGYLPRAGSPLLSGLDFINSKSGIDKVVFDGSMKPRERKSSQFIVLPFRSEELSDLALVIAIIVHSEYRKSFWKLSKNGFYLKRQDLPPPFNDQVIRHAVASLQNLNILKYEGGNFKLEKEAWARLRGLGKRRTKWKKRK